MAQFDAIYLPPAAEESSSSASGPGLTQRKEGCYDMPGPQGRGKGINQVYS